MHAGLVAYYSRIGICSPCRVLITSDDFDMDMVRSHSIRLVHFVAGSPQLMLDI
jgi:hypothetical protein